MIDGASLHQPCPFCKIASTYPYVPNNAVPSDPEHEAVSPSCHLILSSPRVLAFLDIMPITVGHLLLVTREHFDKLHNVPYHDDSAAMTSHKLQSNDKVALLEGRSASQALGFWMPLISRTLSKTLIIEDWNVVQNNGHRAAQVVPHVHFHFIPRYAEGRPELGEKAHFDVGTLKSWKTFGRGSREDLDDEEAAALSSRLRHQLRDELAAEMGAIAKL